MLGADVIISVIFRAEVRPKSPQSMRFGVFDRLVPVGTLEAQEKCLKTSAKVSHCTADCQMKNQDGGTLEVSESCHSDECVRTCRCVILQMSEITHSAKFHRRTLGDYETS